MNYDIAIIGGSVAGLTAAREISNRCDANIIVIEEHNQIGKPANNSIFSFIETVNKYQLKNAVLRYYNKFGWYSFLGSKVIFEFDKPTFVVLDYKRLCQQLAKMSKQPNLEILTSARAIDLEKKKDNILIRTQIEGSNEKIIKSNLLIDASGSSFFSSKFISHKIPKLYSNPFGYELNNCYIPDELLDTISFFVGRSIGTGGGWFYPLSNRICNFGIAKISKKPIIKIDILKEKFEYAKQHLQPFAKYIKDANYHIKKSGVIPAEPMKNLVSDRLMRVGDAAGQATPHIYEGVRPCMESAIICGKVASEAYEKNDYGIKYLNNYEKIWQKKYKLLHLYLLSIAEVAYTLNDRELERSVKTLNKKEGDADAFLNGLKGWFKFPHSFLTLQLDPTYFKTLMRFIYHNLKWIIE